MTLGLLILTGLLMVAALCLLATCIAPTRFRYVSKEPALLRYANDLISAGQAAGNQAQARPIDALAELTKELAHQYAVATDHNRRIDKRRELLRAFAGLAGVGSVLSLLLRAAVAFGYDIPRSSNAGDGHGPALATPSVRPSDRAPPPGRAGTG
ncbi:MAG: hypothetical protein KGL52_00380 [Rhodospirillales bacterium]|nr:hypothetical protein [Rhodospirillales bacterium]